VSTANIFIVQLLFGPYVSVFFICGFFNVAVLAQHVNEVLSSSNQFRSIGGTIVYVLATIETFPSSIKANGVFNNFFDFIFNSYAVCCG
jgi:hypothetical protein